MKVQPAQVFTLSMAPVQRERQYRPDEKQEQRKNQVVDMTTFPSHVLELLLEAEGHRVGPHFGQRREDGRTADDPEHIEPAQSVNGGHSPGRTGARSGVRRGARRALRGLGIVNYL